RANVSASPKTAFLALGSVSCPATSRARSARSSQCKASFRVDGIWSSLISRRSFVSLHLSLAKIEFALPRPHRDQCGSRQPHRDPKSNRQKQHHNQRYSRREPWDGIACRCTWMKSPRMTAPGNSGVVRWWHHIVSHGPVLFSNLGSAGDPILPRSGINNKREQIGPDKPSKIRPHPREVELAA